MATVLLVEDDLMLTKLYSELLTAEGFMVLIARDGQEGLKLASENKIDLILADVMMPRMNGIEMLRNLRENPDYSDTPVIVLTNQADPIERDRAFALKALEYLVKARQKPEEVVEVVKKYVSVNGNTN